MQGGPCSCSKKAGGKWEEIPSEGRGHGLDLASTLSEMGVAEGFEE